MQNYTTQIIVKPEHLDHLQHVNNVQYVSWVQDIAIDHWVKATTKEIDTNYFWVLLQHNITYKKPAFLNDEIIIKTFILKSGGVKSIRCVEFYNKKTNILLVRSETTWCLINRETNKPSRITDEITACFE